MTKWRKVNDRCWKRKYSSCLVAYVEERGNENSPPYRYDEPNYHAYILQVYLLRIDGTILLEYERPFPVPPMTPKYARAMCDEIVSDILRALNAAQPPLAL